MKKLLGIVVLGLLWCNVVYALVNKVTCLYGSCDFTFSIHYDSVISDCRGLTIFNQVADTYPTYFTVGNEFLGEDLIYCNVLSIEE